MYKFNLRDKVKLNDDVCFMSIKYRNRIRDKILTISGVNSRMGENMYQIEGIKGMWFSEDSFEKLYLKKITFDILKSVCANWNQIDRKTKEYDKIRCTITGSICCEIRCPLIND